MLEIFFVKTEKNLHPRNVAISTKSAENNLIFFFRFVCAAQRKALDMMQFQIFFFTKEFMV